METTAEETSLDGTPPGSYMGGQMESMTKGTSKGWRRIGDGGRKSNQ